MTDFFNKCQSCIYGRATKKVNNKYMCQKCIKARDIAMQSRKGLGYAKSA